MRLLVFTAFIGTCWCFYPPLETRNERFGVQPTYVFNKDDYLRQIGSNARVSYANPFLQYQHPYIPLSYAHPQFNNAKGPFNSSVRQQSIQAKPNEISITDQNDAFIQNTQNVPTVLINQRQVPITLTNTPKDLENFKYLQALLSMNKEERTEMTSTEEPGIKLDMLPTRRSGTSNGPMVSIEQNVPQGYLKLDINTLNNGFGQTRPITSVNNDHSRLGYLPNYIVNSIYDNVRTHNTGEEILDYVVGLMLSEKYLSPSVIQVVTRAKNIDLSKLNEIDETKIQKLSQRDIAILKRYIIKILNAYGLTSYIFKLIEYLYLIEGTPKNEIQLALKILTDNGPTQNLSDNELQELKHHLLQIYDDYNESPYILEFLDNILAKKFRLSNDVDTRTQGIDYDNNITQDEDQKIIDFVISIMISENNISPDIMKVLVTARSIDFSKLDKLAEMRLDQVSNDDLARLKKYLIQVVNLFGLTTYTLKLLEYIFILEGRPIIESYLMSLILADNTDVKKFNGEELKLIHSHLLQIYRDYNESPYILAFLKNILDNRLNIVKTDKSDNMDSNDYEVIEDPNQKDIQKMYAHLSQTYNDNPNVLKILKIIYNIYIYVGNDVMLPVIDQNDLQSLTIMKPEDLNLLVKYILHIRAQRGDNIYLNGLLSYINWIQNSEGNTDVSITNHENIAFNATEEKIDLSPIYIYLLELNNSKSNEDIFVILNHLSHKRLPVTTLYSIETLGYGDLIRMKEFLMHNKSAELSPAVLDFISKLNQAIQKQEAKVILDGDQLVKINPDDLEVLEQYMISMQTAVPDYYLNEIIQLIKQGQNLKDENGFGKLKYFDLMQIYKYLLQSQDEDINNPILIKIQQYVNQNNRDINVQKDSNYKKPNVNILETYNVVNDNQINLEELYNFLLHESVTDQSNLLLLELLKYFNENLVTPNGTLLIKILNTNGTTSDEYNSQNGLEKLLPYLLNIKENSETDNNYLYAELLKYLKNKTTEKNDDVAKNPLYVIPIDALYRIKLYLQTFIKEYGENELVLRIILQINQILQAQEKENNPLEVQINDLNVKGDDLKILLQYLTKNGDVSKLNSDLSKIIDYIIKSENEFKYREDYEKNQENIKLLLIKLMNSDGIPLAVKDILQFLTINKWDEDANQVITLLEKSHMLDKLNPDEIHELLNYLMEIKSMVGPNEPFVILIDFLQRLEKGEIELNIINKKTNIDQQVPEFVEKHTEVLKIPSENVKIIIRYLIDLFDQYGQDEDVGHILYKINHTKDRQDKNNDLSKLEISSNNNDLVINIDDVKSITGYIINLINNRGINHDLMKVVRLVFNFNRPTVEDKNIAILGANTTHIEVAIDQKNLDQLKKYFNTIAKNYKLNSHRLNILPTEFPDKKISSAKERDNTIPDNIYTFVIRHEELNLSTKYILELIKEYGMVSELINVLLFLSDIYDESKMTINGQNENQPNGLVVSDEKRVEFQERVMQEIQNSNTDSLKNNYMQFIEKLFDSQNIGDSADSTQVIGELLDMYKKQQKPVNKYILLKLVNYLKNNKETNYETLWDPNFVLVLLGVMNKTSTLPPNSVNKIPINGDRGIVITQPYDYKNDIEGSLSKLIKKMYQVDTNEKNKKIVTNYTIYLNTNGDGTLETQSNINLEKDFEGIDTKEHNENIQGNNTITIIREDKIHGQAKPNIKIERFDKPFYSNATDKNFVYTIFEMSEDGARKHTLHNVEAENVLKPADIKNRNEDILANNKINKIIDHGIGESTTLNTKEEKIHKPADSKEQNHNMVIEYIIGGMSKNGTLKAIEPNIKVENVYKPIDANETNKNNVANYVIKITEAGEGTLPNIQPIEMDENNKIILANTIFENTTNDGDDGRKQSKVNIEKNHESFEPKEVNKNIVGNNTMYKISDDGISRIKVVKVFNPMDTNKINKDIVVNYTINGISDVGSRREIEPNIKPIGTEEKNKNILAQFTVHENAVKEDTSGRTESNINVEINNERFDTEKNNENIIGNNTIYEINKDEINKQIQPNDEDEKLIAMANEENKKIVANYTMDDNRTLPNIKIVKVFKPIATNEININKDANYTVTEINEDGVRGWTQPNINVEINNERFDTEENNKNIIGNNTIYEISSSKIHGQTQPKIVGNLDKPFIIDLNKIVEANNKVFEIGNDEDHGLALPYIKVEKINEAIDANGENKNDVLNNTIYEISTSKIHETQPKINVENLEKPLITNKNKVIEANNKVFETGDDGYNGMASPYIEVHKINEANDANEKIKIVVLNNKISEMNVDKNSEKILPNPKEMSCEKTNMKIKKILAQLHKPSSSNQEQIDLSLNEFLETYEILQKFKTKLSLESHNKILPTNALMRELEERLLSNNMDSCQYQPNAFVKTIISDLVSALRQIIQYMKDNNYDDDKIKDKVASLVKRLLPDINAIAVKDCQERTPKELMSILLTNVYSNKGFEEDEVEFVPGYSIQGSSDEDFLQTLSMQRLLQDIAKYRHL